jgi:hypothetical protein
MVTYDYDSPCHLILLHDQNLWYSSIGVLFVGCPICSINLHAVATLACISLCLIELIHLRSWEQFACQLEHELKSIMGIIVSSINKVHHRRCHDKASSRSVS